MNCQMNASGIISILVPHLSRIDFSTSDNWYFGETAILDILELRTTCRGGGMADAADSKSSIRLLT